MFRFDVLARLREMEEAENRSIPWAEVSRRTGISISVLSNLASARPFVTTNTRFVEALCRYFRCQPGDLLRLDPGLEADLDPDVNVLYPERGAHRPQQE